MSTIKADAIESTSFESLTAIEFRVDAVKIGSIDSDGFKNAAGDILGAGYDRVSITTSVGVTANTFDYLLDTSAGFFTITLPPNPIVGDRVFFYDSQSTFNTNSPIIARNGSNIMGLAEDMILDVVNSRSEFIYTGITKGWVVFT